MKYLIFLLLLSTAWAEKLLLTWDESQHVEYYEVFAVQAQTEGSDGYTFIGKTTEPSFNLNVINYGVFTVRAVNSFDESEFGEYVVIVDKPGRKTLTINFKAGDWTSQERISINPRKAYFRVSETNAGILIETTNNLKTWNTHKFIRASLSSPLRLSVQLDS